MNIAKVTKTVNTQQSFLANVTQSVNTWQRFLSLLTHSKDQSVCYAHNQLGNQTENTWFHKAMTSCPPQKKPTKKPTKQKNFFSSAFSPHFSACSEFLSTALIPWTSDQPCNPQRLCATFLISFLMLMTSFYPPPGKKGKKATACKLCMQSLT